MPGGALGLDLGTSGLKGVLLGRDGSVLASASAEYSFESPRPGWAQIDPAVWERAARRVVRELLGSGHPVESLAVDGQMHGAVLVDAAGEAVHPALLWPDTRARLDALAAAPPNALRALANPLAAGMAGPLAAWLAQNEPAAFARAAALLSPKDWLRSRLVPGSLVTDPSDASATLLWDAPAGDWNLPVARALGVEQLLPPVLPSTSPAGTIPDSVAGEWGLPAGLPVAVGSGDVAAALRGMDARPGTLSLILGSGSQALLTRVSPAATATPRFHSYRAADGSWFAMAASMNGGLALQRVRELLGLDWAQLYDSLAEPLADGDPLFLPFFSGERLPRPIAGGQAGWSGLGPGTSRSRLAASAVEGVLFAVRMAVAELPDNAGPVDLVGGGSRHPLVQQLVADVLGRPVERRTVEDATALGAAIIAWEAAGVTVEPRRDYAVERSEPAASPVLEARYARFTRLVDALH